MSTKSCPACTRTHGHTLRARNTHAGCSSVRSDPILFSTLPCYTPCFIDKKSLYLSSPRTLQSSTLPHPLAPRRRYA